MRKGFSLVELLVVIAIAAIVGGLSVASYGPFARQKKLEVYTALLRQIIETAQKSAISGDMRGCTSVARYMVVITASEAQLYPLCSPSGSGEIQKSTIPQHEDIEYTPLTLSFTPLTGETIGGCVCVRDTRRNSENSIIILSTGVINETKGSCTCS